jgi:hypothetical protein
VGKRKQTIFKKRWFDITNDDSCMAPSNTVLLYNIRHIIILFGNISLILGVRMAKSFLEIHK